MGAVLNRPPSFDKSVMKVAKANINEEITAHRHKGNYGYPFIGKTHFFKVVEFKTNEEATKYKSHMDNTKHVYPSGRACHALESNVVDELFVISKFKKHPQDLFSFARTKCSLEDLHGVLMHLVHTVCEMHSYGVNHCDIKPENVLVTANKKTVLCDLDGMKRITKIQRIGTEYYSPPIGLVREAMYMRKLRECTWFDVYSFIDLFALGKTLETVLAIRKVHVPAGLNPPAIGAICRTFWEGMIKTLTDSNIRYFFSDDHRKLRAADCIQKAIRFGLPVEFRVCDCMYRAKEWSGGCGFCYAPNEVDVDEVPAEETRVASAPIPIPQLANKSTS